MTQVYGSGYPLPSSGHYNYYNGGMTHFGGGYNQYGYGGMNFGPYNSTPLTPYENLAARSFAQEQETKGMVIGGIIGGAVGFLGGPLAPLTVPLGAAVGAGIGKFFGGLFGRDQDARDDGKLNGSPLLMEMSHHA